MAPLAATELDTRTRLLRAAAHLFARKGIDGVRNQEIHELAGQRNESALHYHFGGRWKVVAAILEENDLVAAPVVEARRAAPDSPHAVVAFLVERLAVGLGSPEGRDWLRIVNELMARAPGGSGGIVSGHRAQLDEVAERLAGLVDVAPPAVVRRRAVAMVRFLTAQMAERARQVDDGAPGPELDEATFLDELAAMAVGMVTAAPRRHLA